MDLIPSRMVSVSLILMTFLAVGSMMPATVQAAPGIINPTPGSTLTTSTVTFTGEHASGDSPHFLIVGTMPGGSNLHYSGSMPTAHSQTVSGLPTSGTIYVRWYWTSSRGWEFQNHTYTMNVGGGGGGGGGNGDHASLALDHANLALDHDGLDQKLDQVLAGLNNFVQGAPCGQGALGQRFVVNGPAFCDNTTGLYWQQTPGAPGNTVSTCDNGNDCTWQAAGDYCAALGGGSRLPKVKELISLMDFTVAGPPSPQLPVGIPITFVSGISYWSAESVAIAAPSSPFAWVVGFIGSISNIDKSGARPAWCVR